MKKLKELKGTFGSKDIGELVDFVNNAPIQLPEDKKYHFEKDGKVVNVYGVGSGITQYSMGTFEQGTRLKGIKPTSKGTTIYVKFGGIEQVILHSKPYKLGMGARKPVSGESRPVLPSESRNASSESRGSSSARESRYHNEGESRRYSSEGESRR